MAEVDYTTSRLVKTSCVPVSTPCVPPELQSPERIMTNVEKAFGSLCIGVLPVMGDRRPRTHLGGGRRRCPENSRGQCAHEQRQSRRPFRRQVDLQFLPSGPAHRHRGIRRGDPGGGQVSRLGTGHARLGAGLSRGWGERRRRGGGRQGPGPGAHLRRRQSVLAGPGFVVRRGTDRADPGQAHAHLVPGRLEEPGSLRRFGLLRARHGQVRTQRQVQARREVAAAGPRFRSGAGLGLSAGAGQVRPRRDARSSLVEREDGRRARVHQAECGRRQFRPRRRAAHPFLGRRPAHRAT